MQPLSADRTTSHLAPAIVIMTSEEPVAARIQAIITAQGGRAVNVTTPAAFVEAMDRNDPVLAIVDLATPGDWATAIARCKLRPHTQAIPIYAFGDATDGAVYHQARQAGVDVVWPQARLCAELATLVDHHLHPPVYYPEGWDDILPGAAQAGLVEFNAGRYFEQHEHLEEAWRGEPRPIRVMYQGILQVGLAFLQIQRGNWSGALKMFRRGLPRLRNLPAVCQGVQVGRFRALAEAIHAEIVALGPGRLAEFDQTRFPQVEFTPVEHLAQPAPDESEQISMDGSDTC
jgi:hypothetical protein